MYRFAANLVSKARVAKSSAHQGLNMASELSYGGPIVKNVGASLAKKVVNATNGVVGHGTTCASVLTREILSKGCKSVSAGMNTMDQRCGASMISTLGEIRQFGSASPSEVGEKKDRFTAAPDASMAAVQLGTFHGGSFGLLYASKNLATANFHRRIGVGISQNALQMPVRTFASNAAVEEEANLINTLRPLSPHLPIYKPQVSSTFSIFHRITGAFLSTMVLSFYLVTMKMGSVCLTFESFYQFLFYSSKLTVISAEISALALSFHVYNGIRHLWTDYAGFPIFGRRGSGALKAIAKKGH